VTSVDQDASQEAANVVVGERVVDVLSVAPASNHILLSQKTQLLGERGHFDLENFG
jgi:hypothetical protein